MYALTRFSHVELVILPEPPPLGGVSRQWEILAFGCCIPTKIQILVLITLFGHVSIIGGTTKPILYKPTRLLVVEGVQMLSHASAISILITATIV
jgi:hypothetical protein